MTRIGVLTDTALIVQGEQHLHTMAVHQETWLHPVSVGMLLSLAHTYEIGQLWVHPSFTQRWGDLDYDRGGSWDIRPRLPERAAWYRAFIPDVRGTNVDLVFPEREALGVWKRAETGQELAEQLVAYNWALQFPYRYSPGTTGTGLMREVHGASHPDDPRYRHLDIPGDAPPAAGLHPDPGRDIHWIRGLTQEEQGYTYLHAIDKNAMYLGAASSLELGMGAWEHDTKRKWYPPESHWPLLPGYYRVDEYTTSGNLPLLAPRATDPDGQEMANPSAPLWLTAPVVAVCLEHGYDMTIGEAYRWPQHARMLAPWQARIRAARLALQEQDAPLALANLKLTYALGISWLDGHWHANAAKRDTLYRPDWRHMVIGQAAANLWRQTVKAVRNGVPVVAVVTDCLYVLSDERAATHVAEQAGLKLGTGIGEWKIQNEGVPLDEVREFFAADDMDGLGVQRHQLRLLGQYLGRRPPDADI